MSRDKMPTDPNVPVWIEREDQAKQSMARKGNLGQAEAAPNRIVIREGKTAGLPSTEE